VFRRGSGNSLHYSLHGGEIACNEKEVVDVSRYVSIMSEDSLHDLGGFVAWVHWMQRILQRIEITSFHLVGFALCRRSTSPRLLRGGPSISFQSAKNLR
jgi:hypothetical protein